MDGNLLLSVLGGLGRIAISDDGLETYIRDDDCLECLKDLQRFLRHDDPATRDAFFVLGKAQTTRLHLIPLITRYAEDADIVYNALKVVTFLTMPVEPESQSYCAQIDAMRDVKEAFLAQDALVVIVSLVAQPLSRHAESLMTERDTLIVQLVITFLRNLIVIPDSARQSGSSGSHRARMSSELLKRLIDDSALELLLIMAQHISHGRLRGEAPLMLEIFARLFGGIQPEGLLSRGDDEAAQPARRQEAQRAQRGARQAPALQAAKQPSLRHPRFGGVFTKTFDDGLKQCSVAGAKQKDLLGPVSAAAKTGAKKETEEAHVHFEPEMSGLLNAYVDRFLQSSYNILMTGLQKDLNPGINISRLRQEDFLRFFKLTTFFIRYVRLQEEGRKGSKEAMGGRSGNPQPGASSYEAISATLGWETFRLVHSTWLTAIDLPSRDENKWEMQHTCLALLKEMLMTLDLALQRGSSADRQAADRLQRRLLHDDQKESGLLPILARLIKQFDHRVQSRDHAHDLVQCLHVVLRMLERLGREEAGGFLVQRRLHRAGRRKAQKTSPASSPGAEPGSQTEPGDGDASSPGKQAGSPTSGNSPQAMPQGRSRDQDPLEELQQDEVVELNHRLKEVAVDLNQRIRQELAFPAVVHFYSWLLQGYITNGHFLNHCLVAFLKRLADPDGINLEPMIWQVSVLRVFHQLLASAPFRKQPGSSEVLRFAVRIVHNIFARLVPAKSPTAGISPIEGEEVASGDNSAEASLNEGMSALLFVEMLFWKNAHDSADVRDEYKWRDLYQRDNAKPDLSEAADTEDQQAGAGEKAKEGDGSEAPSSSGEEQGPAEPRAQKHRDALDNSSDTE